MKNYTWIFVYVLLLLLKDALSLEQQARKTMYSTRRQNVCREQTYYFSGATNKQECWYNPDVDSYAHDIIRRYGYNFESYKVTSEDGYITTLFRIPNSKGQEFSTGPTDRPPVLLLHGLATSSHVMVDIGKESLAFVLVDAGYDVWLGNLRGSSYSMGHLNMSYKEKAYWKFSFHEMGNYDLPANLEFIHNETEGKQVIYIGHSVAASAFHVFEALHRESAKKLIKVALLIAPLTFLSDIRSPQPEFEGFGNPLMILATLLGIKTNTTDAKKINFHRVSLCKRIPTMFHGCRNGLYLAFGLGSINIPSYYIPLMMAHNPSGFSANTLNHLLQISYNEGDFQMYDYGVRKNQELYASPFPPEYDLGGCEVPIIIFYGANDWICTEKDIKRLGSILPKGIVKQKYKIKSPMWKHMDYFYGKQLYKLFYQPLLESLKKFGDSVKSSDTDGESALEANQRTGAATETIEDQTIEATTPEAEITEAQTKEAETTKALTTETSAMESEATEASTTEATITEEETTEAETTETETPEMHTTETETTEAIETESTEAETTKAITTKRSTTKRITENLTTKATTIATTDEEIVTAQATAIITELQEPAEPTKTTLITSPSRRSKGKNYAGKK